MPDTEPDYRFDAAFANPDYAKPYAHFARHGVAHVSESGRYLDCNQAFAEILQRTKGEIIGQSFEAFTAAEDITMDWAQMRDLLNSLSNRYEMQKSYLTKGGKRIPVNIRVWRYPASVAEPFGHFVVHCYALPPVPNALDLVRGNKVLGAAATGAVAGVSYVGAHLDELLAILRALLRI